METKIKIPSLIFFNDKQNKKKNNFDKLSCSSLNQALIEARSIISNTPHPCQNKFCQQYHNAPSLHNNNNGNRNISHEVISTKTSDLKEVVLNLYDTLTNTETDEIQLFGNVDAMSKFFHNLSNNSGEFVTNSGYIKINSEYRS